MREYAYTKDRFGISVEPTGNQVFTSLKAAKTIMIENAEGGESYTLWAREMFGGWERVGRYPH